MPTVKEIVDFLQDIGATQTIWGPMTTVGLQEVVGVNTDDQAQPGQLAWLSARNLENEPNRLAQFSGSLLICPQTCIDSTVLSPTSVYAVCRNAKLSFIRVVSRFFSWLAEIDWPSGDHESICHDAQISSAARLSKGVVVGPRVVIQAKVVIGPNTVIANSVVKRGARIGANCTIGMPGFGFEKDENGRYLRFPHIGGVLIREYAEIGSNTCIDRGAIGDTIIGRRTKVDNLVHIAHNVVIGSNCLVIANTMLGGSSRIGRNVWIAPSVSVMNQVSIGDAALLGMGAVVLRDVAQEAVMAGNPAKELVKKSRDG